MTTSISTVITKDDLNSLHALWLKLFSLDSFSEEARLLMGMIQSLHSYLEATISGKAVLTNSMTSTKDSPDGTAA